MKKIIAFLTNRNFKVVFGTVIGTLIYCIGIVFILDLGEFYAGGITGIAQVIVSLTGSKMVGLKSIIIAVLNAPLFLIAWKGVSKRFSILTLISVILQVAFIAILEHFATTFVPFQEFKDNGDILTLAILGGLVTGAGCGISLKCGSSTGGMDILSQYVSLKKHISFAKFSLTVDLAIIFVAAVFGSPAIAVYTVIRMIISVLVLDKIHTIYKYGKVSIITDEKQRMRDALIKNFNHGVTIYQAMGGFTNKPRYVLDSIVWSFEADDYMRIAKSIDPKCFITYSAIKRVEGSFNINVIA